MVMLFVDGNCFFAKFRKFSKCQKISIAKRMLIKEFFIKMFFLQGIF